MYRFTEQRDSLRTGYSTGTCAAAAAKAAVIALITGNKVDCVSVLLPDDIEVNIHIDKIEKTENGYMALVRKDSGDDPDITDGTYIGAEVSISTGEGISIDGGPGIGRVTRPGLDQPVGAAAINSVPRKMIHEAVRKIMLSKGRKEGLKVIVFCPEGERLARNTMNGELGIVGGISILGTKGIVYPMSQDALVQTIEIELKVLKEEGKKRLILTPGNYGMEYLLKNYPKLSDQIVKCSNYIGTAIDKAIALGFEEILLIGHIGKISKLASGIFQTHSKVADGRMESLAIAALIAGVERNTILDVLKCNTTDSALKLLKKENALESSMKMLGARIESCVERRIMNRANYGILFFSNKYGTLYTSDNAVKWIKET